MRYWPPAVGRRGSRRWRPTGYTRRGAWRGSFSAPHADHPAVTLTDAFLDGGGAVADLYTAALRSRWPTFEPVDPLPDGLEDGAWLEAVADFYTDTAVAAFHWSEQAVVWRAAAADLAGVVAPEMVAAFFAALLGAPLDRPVRLYPNLLFPAMTPLLVSASEAYTLLLPPPMALGESPPWAYHEGEEWVLTHCAQLVGEAVLQPQLAHLDPPARRRTIHAVTTLFLENARDSGAGRAYQVQIARTADIADLGEAVDRLRAYLKAPNGASLLTVMQGPPAGLGA